MDDFGAFYELHVTAVTAYVARRARRPDLAFDLVAARADRGRGAFNSRDGGVFYAVVNERVATVVLDGRRFAARPDPRVPSTWKLVLVELAREPGPEMRFLDAAGQEVPNVDPRGSWPAARHRYPTRRADPDGRCRMRVGTDSPFRVRSTSAMSSPPPGRDDVVQPSLLACATTVYYLGKLRLRAAILLNARDPSGPAPLLPGMAAEPAGIVATGRLTSARRAGDGWLMVYRAAARAAAACDHRAGAVRPTRNHTRASPCSTPHESASRSTK